MPTSLRKPLRAAASKLNVDADFLASTIRFETGPDPWSTSVKNPHSGATGLIQFMPSTAKALGTTTAALAAMNHEQQMQYVVKYFTKLAPIPNSIKGVYLSVFWPKFRSNADSTVIAKDGEIAYAQNAGFDREKKGYFTVGDTYRPVREIYAKAKKEKAKVPVAWERVLFVGDSLAVGLAAPLERSLMTGKHHGKVLTYKSEATGGSRTDQWARWIGKHLTPAPDLVVISVGGNDFIHDPEKVLESAKSIVAQAKAVGAKVMWVEPPPIPWADRGAMAAWRSLVPERMIFPTMAHEPEQSADKVHPTWAEYKRLGSLLADQIVAVSVPASQRSPKNGMLAFAAGAIAAAWWLLS